MEEADHERKFATTSTREEMDEAFHDPSIDDEKLREILESIEIESVQLSKHLSEEKSLISEICELLQKTVKHFKVSIEISPSHLESDDKPEKALLDDEGNVALYYGEGHIVSKALEKCEPEIVVAVVWEVLKKLPKAIQRYEHKVQERTSRFKKVRSNLKNLLRNLSAH